MLRSAGEIHVQAKRVVVHLVLPLKIDYGALRASPDVPILTDLFDSPYYTGVLLRKRFMRPGLFAEHALEDRTL